MTAYLKVPTINEVMQVQDWFDQVSYWVVTHSKDRAVSEALYLIEQELKQQEIAARQRQKAALYGG
jgi:hypothetical protein